MKIPTLKLVQPFYITSHLSQALNWCHYLFKAAASGSGEGWKDGVDFDQVSQALIPLTDSMQ